MFNTWGIRSVNTGTFNLNYRNYFYKKSLRDVIVTSLRMHNLALNIAGYMPKVSGIPIISGYVRMFSGLSICILTLTIGERNAQKGAIIQHWYDEALLTGVAQIARGALEAFVPYGQVANIALDTIGTFANILGELSLASASDHNPETANPPHPNPDYPFPFWLLYLV